jgi:hypothetical protein
MSLEAGILAAAGFGAALSLIGVVLVEKDRRARRIRDGDVSTTAERSTALSRSADTTVARIEGLIESSPDPAEARRVCVSVLQHVAALGTVEAENARATADVVHDIERRLQATQVELFASSGTSTR